MRALSLRLWFDEGMGGGNGNFIAASPTRLLFFNVIQDDYFSYVTL